MKLVACWIALCWAAVGVAQPYLDRTLYPERLHEEVELLRAAIHEAHPDPYRYHTKPELDALIDRVRDSITVPLSLVEFEQVLLPVFKGVGDAHCRPEWPQSMRAALEREALLIPLQVKVLPEGVFVEDELKGFRSIPVGSRIISINGSPIAAILNRLLGTVVCDGANRTLAERVVEREFNVRYHLYVERAGSFRVAYRTPDGEAGEKVVFGMTHAEIMNTRKPKGAAMLSWGSTVYPEHGVLWLTMNTLELDGLELGGQRPDRFLQATLNEAFREKVRTVVIDVRGAGGRELSMAELVFSAIAKTPFKMLDGMVVRSIAPPKARPTLTIPESFYASSNARLLLSGQGEHRIPETDPRLSLHEPMTKAFGGKVYVVCDGYTRDAAAALVMMVRRENRGRVVGEEVGSNAFGFTGGPEWVITTPFSGLRFHVPLLKYEPAGRGQGPTDRGEQPNHLAYPTQNGLVNGRDQLRSSLLEMIQELE